MSDPHQQDIGSLAPRIVELVARFEEIGETQMKDLPLYNPGLEVEAVGFEEHRDEWMGVLITPWFMNVLVLPRDKHCASFNDMGKNVRHLLPSGERDFLTGGDEVVGGYAFLSLHSPMEKFKVQGQARAEARLRLAKLMEPPPQAQDALGQDEQAAAQRSAISRRELFRGREAS